MKKLATAISLFALLACSTERASAPLDDTEPQNTVKIGGRLAFVSTRDGAAHIYVANPDGTNARRLTNATQSEFTPAWAADGSRLAFNSSDGNTYVINSDGSGLVRLPNGGSTPSWLPDGRRLLVGTQDGFRIVAADASSDNDNVIRIDTTRLSGVQGVSEPWGGKWSPDGSRIAFAAWISGPDFSRAFVANIDGSNGRTFLSRGNIVWEECGPEWSPDGSRIALLSMIHGITVVDMRTGTATPIVNPGTTCWDGDYNRVAWSPDGRALALTRRNPPWIQGQPTPPQTASIVIVDLETRTTLATIPDAYDPAWTRDK